MAARLQQRVTAIMRYAVQSGLIDYNPAQDMAGAVATGKRARTRSANGIDDDIKLNKALWVMMEKMYEYITNEDSLSI